jgi:hypothetical protein
VDEEPSLHLSSGIIREIAGGANEAFDRLLRRYNNVLVQKAAYYLRRIRRYDAFYEAQEAVDDALATMFDRARQGEPLTIQTAVEFWREFFYDRQDRHRARQFKRHLGSPKARWRDRRGRSLRTARRGRACVARLDHGQISFAVPQAARTRTAWQDADSATKTIRRWFPPCLRQSRQIYAGHGPAPARN